MDIYIVRKLNVDGLWYLEEWKGIYRVQKRGKLQEGSIEDIVWVLKVGEEWGVGKVKTWLVLV